MRYQYYISTTGISGTYSEIFPNVQAKLSTKLENDTNDFRWCYRDRCSEIKLTKSMNSAIYATLASWFTDTTKHATQIFIKIYRGTSAGTLIYTGYFSITDGELNTQNGVYTVTPITQDNYTIFDQVRDKDINTFDYTWYPLTTSSVVRFPDAIAKVIGSWSNVSFNVFTAIGAGIVDAQNTSGLNELCYIPITGTFYSDRPVYIDLAYAKISGTNPVIYLTESTGVTLITANQTLSAGGVYNFTLDDAVASYTNIRLYIYSTATVRFSSSIISCKAYRPLRYNTDIVWEAATLKSVFAHILYTKLSTAYSAANIKSTFIFQDALPTNPPGAIDTYITANPTHNYVTEAVNKLNNLYFLFRNDFREISGESISNYFVRFSQFMSDMNYYLNVYWYIDDDGKFRIEHYKYFEGLRSAGIDVTAGVYPAYKPEVDNKKYRFTKEELPQIEHWANQYDKNTDFVGEDIIYSVYPTSENKKDYQAALISTDIENLYTSLTDGIEGLALVQCESVGAFYDIATESGALSSTVISNGHLSLANLHAAYWMNGRFYEAGTMNGAAETFDTVILTQESSVKFPTTADLNDYGYVTTSFGDGIIDEYDRNLDTDFITAKLLYEAY